MLAGRSNPSKAGWLRSSWSPLTVFSLILLLGTGLQAQDPTTMGPRFLQTSSGSYKDAVPLGSSDFTVLNQLVTLDVEGARFEELIREVSAQTGLNLVFSSDLISPDYRITLSADGITLAELLERVLHGASVDIVLSGNQAALVQRGPEIAPAEVARQEVGTVTGRITESTTGRGMPNVSIILEGTRIGTSTNQSGFFRLENVPVGDHSLLIQQIGYAEERTTIKVSRGQETVVNVSLEISALPLDELVVTGTGFETRRRTVPNPITVITAEEIEQKQPSDIISLIRGEIPGLLPLSAGKDDRAPEIYVRGNSGWSSTDYIKIYIDGIQVAHSTLITTIDPKNIERIEVVRGPQASVIYGSEAASGVLQIFTKKGTSLGADTPRLELMASTGLIESDHVPSDVKVPLMQDYSLGLTGGADAFTYRAGVNYGHVGEWVRGYSSESLGLSSAFRVVQGPLTAEFSALWSNRKPRVGADPIYMRYEQSVNCPQCGNPDYIDNTIHTLGQSTMGLTLTYQATSNWQHNLILGNDLNRNVSYQREPGLLVPSDTFVDLMQQETQRRSIRYNTAYETGLGDAITARFTLGGDYWHYDIIGNNSFSLLSAFPSVIESDFTYTSISNNKWWNAGYFGMAELGLKDRLFITMAARIEEMQNLGDDYGRPVQPRIGASYVHEVGAAELKLRGQWGKGIRMPPASARVGSTSSFSVYLPNPDIGPEEKAGWDAGVELHWPSLGSIAVTRYDEVGRNLIQIVNIDMAGTPPVYQYQNIGKVGSKGWEIEGTLNIDRFTMRANYAYADNKILELANSYTEAAYQSFRVGDRRAYIPKHSGGGSITSRLWRGSATLNASVMKDWRAMDALGQFDYFFGDGEPRDDWYIDYPSLWKWNFRSEQTLSPRVNAFLRIDNLTNHQGTDYENYSVAQGRTTVIGVRITTN